MTLLEHDWTAIAGMLRREIQEYGKLFRILETQRESLLRQDIDKLIELNGELGAQTDLLLSLKQQREALVSELWSGAGRTGDATVSGLITAFPHETAPLMTELLHEVNRLVGQSRRHLERNQMLFTRVSAITTRFLRTLHPGADRPDTYQRNGKSRYKRGVNEGYSRYVNRA